MLRILGVGGALIFAAFVVFVSIIKSSAPNFAFYQTPLKNQSGIFVSGVEYYFPSPGIGPGHRLWPLKALRDKVWLSATQDPERRADLLLLFADKRLKMADELLQKNEPALAVATAIKGEQYLLDAFNEQKTAHAAGVDTTGFVIRLANASLKHREVLETMMGNAPSDATPVFSETLNYSKMVYESALGDLNQRGVILPPDDQSGKSLRSPIR